MLNGCTLQLPMLKNKEKEKDEKKDEIDVTSVEKKRLQVVRKLQRKYNKLAYAYSEGKLLIDIKIERKVREKLRQMSMKKKKIPK